MIRRIGSALEELHKEHIFHLDVKSELLPPSGDKTEVKISDVKTISEAVRKDDD